MRLTTILVAVACLVAGCAGGSGSERSTIRPAERVTTRPVLKDVDLRYGIYLARIEIHTTITPEGWLRSVRTDNKSYGPNDIDPKRQRTQIREGRLAPEQIVELAELFDDWESLSSERYGGVPDGPGIQIRYGDKSVSGGSAAPKQVWDIDAYITKVTARMPVVEE